MKITNYLCIVFMFIVKVKCASFCYDNNKASPDSYCYDNTENWQRVSKDCNGKFQSPINIIDRETIYDPKLTSFNFDGYNHQTKWSVNNNGYTVIFNPVDNETHGLKFQTSSLNGTFTLLQFHFHWGHNDHEGSEHYLDGFQFPGELHLVHKSENNEIAVLGFFLKLSNDDIDNPALDELLYGVEIAHDTSDIVCVNLKMESIIPNRIKKYHYYRYDGSLTTPPCTEGVIWTVFEKPIEISSRQMKAFHLNSIHNNFREPQKLYSRKIYTSREF